MMATRTSAQEVAAIGTFQGLGAEALEECANLAVRRPLAAGRVVFGQGEPGTRFHALLSGWIRISQAGRDGGQALMRFVGPSEPFGSFGMFADGCYPAEATAVADSIELSWSEAHFRQLVERHPAIAINLLRLAAGRLAELQDRLREITTQPAEQRIASALLRLAARNGRRLEQGGIEIAWPLSRKDIAAVAATALYTASRIMARWERKGIVASSRRRVSIRSPGELARIGDTAP
jgi:CRP/FNR family transcriptional regulator, nitrogen oxide reductase regulator